MQRRRPGRTIVVGLVTAVAVTIAGAGIGIAMETFGSNGAATAGFAPQGSPQRERYFAEAATEFHVPESVLLAVSYNLTRGEDHDNKPAADGSVGPMALVDPGAVIGAKTGQRSAVVKLPAGTPAAPGAQPNMLDTAAALLHESPDQLRDNEQQNIRGGAALLADLARKNGGIPSSVDGWYEIVARYAGVSSNAGMHAFADDVFATLRQGFSYTTSDGQSLRSAALADLGPTQSAGSVTAPTPPGNGTPDQPAPECPPGLNCRFVPAAYDWSSANHSDPNNYGNYDPANRPSDGNQVRYIVIHDTEEVPGTSSTPYDQAIRAFQDPAGQSSAHYVIRSSDGAITQMVPTKDIAWHSDNWTLNSESIGIEHEGVEAQGGSWYTEPMYRASAKLVRYLAAKYHIPLDRQHVIGHEDVAPSKSSQIPDAHTDPGAYWDWNHFMDLLGASDDSSGGGHVPRPGQAVTIHPDYATNKPPVSQCDSKKNCTPLPSHGTNFVPLHTLPDADSPLINDKVVHPDGSSATTAIDDWTDKAVSGRTYVVAAQRDDWTAIWYDGQQAWFYDPDGANVTSAPTNVFLLATALPGKSSAPLYPRAFPQQDEYPPTIPFQPDWAVTPLPWTLPAGQQYAVVGQFTAQNYYATYDGANKPDNHRTVQGREIYLLLSYNHRYVWVKRSDVQVRPVTQG